MSKSQQEKPAKTATRNSDRRNGKAGKKLKDSSVWPIKQFSGKTVFGYSKARWEAWTPEQRAAKRERAETRSFRRSRARAMRRTDVRDSLFFRGMATVEQHQYEDHQHYRLKGQR